MRLFSSSSASSSEARCRDLDGSHLRQHHLHARALRRRTAEVTADALAQVARLADVERLTLGAEHAVDAGQMRQPAHEDLGLEGTVHDA